MVICTWKRRRGASVASTASLMEFCASNAGTARAEMAKNVRILYRINAKIVDCVQCSMARGVTLRILVCMLLTATAFGQGPIEPPPFIQFVRKPGTAPGLLRPYPNARAAVDVVGMTAVT